ncbi:MAG: hypothetical protein L0J35_00190 [Tetragenococcus halophilus]|nr:hypothetical protein [Tetragenococcus halophilus]
MFEDDDLFDFLERERDEKATVRQVRRVLKNYLKIGSMAEESVSIGTSKFSENGHIKKKVTNSDIVGKSVTRKVMSQQELAEIERALKKVSSEYRRVLKAKYTKDYYEHDFNIYMDMGLSEKTFYRYIRKGEMQFAENYKNGMLLVFED